MTESIDKLLEQADQENPADKRAKARKEGRYSLPYPEYLQVYGLCTYGNEKMDKVTGENFRQVKGLKEGSMQNCLLIFDNESAIKKRLPFYEDFSSTLQIQRRGKYESWTDNDTKQIRLLIEKITGYVPQFFALEAAIVERAKENKRNLVKERIEAQNWDGKHRLDTLFIDCLGVDDDPSGYARAVTRKWLAGAVKRVYEPGCKFELVPMLTGEQGIGKSSLIRRLASPAFFNDSLAGMSEKDDRISLLGNWMLELSELEALKKSTIAQIKAFISSQEDKYREPYGKLSTDHPRKSVFIGTTNESEFLKDPTGNRRFFPLFCHKDKIKMNPNDRQALTDDYILQVLAEAKEAYKHGERVYIDERHDPAIYKQAQQAQDQVITEDPFTVKVFAYLNTAVPDGYHSLKVWQKRAILKGDKPGGVTPAQWNNRKPLQETSTREILEVAFEFDPKDFARDKGNQRRVNSAVLETKEWVYSKHVRGLEPGRTVRGYYRVKRP